MRTIQWKQTRTRLAEIAVVILLCCQVLQLGSLGRCGESARWMFASDTVSKDDEPRSFNEAANKTAIVYRTHAPIRPYFMKKILALALELQETDYDFVVLVDETKVTGTAHRLRAYFDIYASVDMTLPLVFPVTESMIIQEYPRLKSYLYNYPEPNVNNETGICCDRPIMWQMFVPAFTLMMRKTNYAYAWEIEDDLDILGNQSMVQLIQRWDDAIQDQHVDLVGELTYVNMIPIENEFIRERHTRGFAKILERMNPKLLNTPHWTSITETPKWTCLSDALQRHSRAFSKRLYEQISKNVYAFCECFVQPIAWDANMTMRELSMILGPNAGIQGFEDLTLKTNRTSAEKRHKQLLKIDLPTFLFHEEDAPFD